MLGEELSIVISLIPDLLGLAALERDAVALVLQTLGSDQTLDARSLGVRLLALALGLDLATNDVLADLYAGRKLDISLHFTSQTLPPLRDENRHGGMAGDDGTARA